MPLKLKRKNMDPPSGWIFEVESGFHIKAGHFDKLVRLVRRHLEANKYEIPENLEEVIENYICLQNPESICSGDGPKRHFPSRKEVESATRAIVEIVTGKDSFTSPEEAEERAAKCVNCRHNLNIWGCFLCTGLMKLITKAYKRTTSRDKQLKACAVCKCVNAAQVHLSEKVLASLPATALLTEYPDSTDCWKREILEKAKIDGNKKKIYEEKSQQTPPEVPKSTKSRRVRRDRGSPDDQQGRDSGSEKGQNSQRSSKHSRKNAPAGGENSDPEGVASGAAERKPPVE